MISFSPKPGSGTPSGPCVVIADDDESFRLLTATLLTRYGFVVQQASEGAEALALLHQDSALLLTDIVMPTTEGLQTIFEARRRYPALKILAISGVDNGHQYLQIAKQFGADAVLNKAQAPERLVPTICDLLSFCNGEDLGAASQRHSCVR